MQNIESLLNLNRQNNKLAIRIISPTFGHLPPEIAQQYGLTHRKPYYFFLFMLEGHTQHGVDLQQFDIKANELLFICLTKSTDYRLPKKVPTISSSVLMKTVFPYYPNNILSWSTRSTSKKYSLPHRRLPD
jgi:hypothetical protein